MALLLLLFLFIYPFILYPVMLNWISRRRRHQSPAVVEPAEWPTVAIVVCALNEARIMQEKIENCLALDYPNDRLRIVVIDDGSTDGTGRIARQYVSHGFDLIECKQRRGKTANLNDVIPSRPEEIIVLSDANVIYDRLALKHLVRRFSDPSVGCVSGKVVLTNTTNSLKAGEGNYYSLEWRLQEDASNLYSMVGADGAMYALRRVLFQPVPNDTLLDDFVISMGIVRQGRRIVFERRALAWEQGPSSVSEEYRRKIRIAAGAAQGLIRGNIWPAGAPWRYWFLFLSHKVLRWVSPLVAIVLLGVCVAHWGATAPMAILGGAMSLVALAGARALRGRPHPVLDAPFYFLLGQLALAVGLLRGLTRRQSVLWAKADR